MDSTYFDVQARQRLSESDLDAIKGLEGTCNESDGLKLKLNWGMLYERQPGETNDFLCYGNDGQLVGYLAMYGFGRPEVEISGMVHPSYRCSGVFSGLLERAADECRQRSAKSLLFICDRKSTSGVVFVKALGAVFDHSENKMELLGDTEPIEIKSSIVLRRARAGDFDMLAKLDAICFDMPEDEARTFYSEKNLLVTDELYVAVLDGTDIGMVKLHKENDDILIFGFGIQPAYRGRGYGRTTLGRAVNAALERKPVRVVLEVDCVNDTALLLYKSCGFQTTATYDYYRLLL